MREGIFDSHAHYHDERFTTDETLPLGAVALLEELFEKRGIAYIMNAATNVDSTKECIALAEKFPYMYASAGVHPEDCAKWDGQMQEVLQEIRTLLEHPKVRAIGEIGLDYHYDFSPRDVQMRWFDAQLSLAEETGYPVIIHDRDAHGKTMEMLHAHKKACGILHSFSGSGEMVKELWNRNFYFSFSGTVTFKNASKILDAVRAVPDERLLLETDCPYLAPVPMRGKINHSGYLPYTATALAAVRDTTTEHIIQITKENACRVFGIDEITKGIRS